MIADAGSLKGAESSGKLRSDRQHEDYGILSSDRRHKATVI